MHPLPGHGVTPLSALFLVKHEVETLERAVRSLDGLDAQVVIGVDATSVDGTRELARELGDALLEVHFTGDFAQARNQLLAHATGRWCLTIDGHEFLDPTAVQPLRDCLAADAHGRGAIALTVRCTEVDGGVRALCVRLFRREGSRYEGAIHEAPVGWGNAFLPRPEWTLHHDRAAAAAQARSEQRLASDRILLQRMCQRDPSALSPWLRLSVLELERGDLAAAEHTALQAWSRSSPEPTNQPFRLEVALQLAEVALAAGALEAAQTWLDTARSLRWDVPVLYVNLARLAEARGHVDEAKAWLRTAMNVPQAPWEFPLQVRHHAWWPAQELARLDGR